MHNIVMQLYLPVRVHLIVCHGTSEYAIVQITLTNAVAIAVLPLMLCTLTNISSVSIASQLYNKI